MTLEERYRLLHELLDFAEAMLGAGAEVNRVEDSLHRLSAAYGAQSASVVVINTNVIVTLDFEDGVRVTETRCVEQTRNHYQRIEALNRLSRDCCKKPIPLEELHARITAILGNAVDWKKIYGGGVLAAASFTVFFGGSLKDAALAGVFALLICLMQRYLAPCCTNSVTFNLLSAFVVGVLIFPVARLLGGIRADKVMIGDIMLLIPGLAMTCAVRDMLTGDTMSGMMRFTETLVWAGALASGFMAALWIVG